MESNLDALPQPGIGLELLGAEVLDCKSVVASDADARQANEERHVLPGAHQTFNFRERKRREREEKREERKKEIGERRESERKERRGEKGEQKREEKKGRKHESAI